MWQPKDEFTKLVQTLRESMIQTAWRVLHDVHDAEDALQDALASIWRRWAEIQRHPNPAALALRISADAAIAVLRRKSRLRRREVSEVTAAEPSASAANPLQQLAAKELRGQILDAIGRMPAQQAAAALMRWIQEQPYAAIAAALGCSEATARKHVARGRQRLSSLLKETAPVTCTED
jgi:RNA polymerase sigma factor (sigma-70 family)